MPIAAVHAAARYSTYGEAQLDPGEKRFTAVYTVTGTTVTLVSAGTCTITADQAGNATYSAAAPVTQSFSVGRMNNVYLPFLRR